MYSKKNMNSRLFINDEILSLFRNDERISAVYLHGSYAIGIPRSDSDIDFAILPKSGFHFNSYERASLATSLTLLLGKSVDLGEISSKNLIYAKEVLTKGFPVFVQDDYYCQFMTMTLLSMYTNFNEDRSEVLNAWTSR